MRTAIIGLGAMGKRHVMAVEQVPELTLAAVADIRSGAFDDARLAEDVVCHRDPGFILRSEAPELVVVSTTAPSHRELVEAAVDAGARAILCEKPIACSLSDAREMVERCRKADVAFAVSHVRRHVPAYRWIAENIAAGCWGELRGIRASVPGIGLGCLGTHFVDLMLLLAGTPLASVAGWIDQPLGENPRGAEFVDPGGVVVGETEDGAMLYLHQIEDAAGPHLVTIDLTGARVVVDEWARSVDVLVRDSSVPTGPGCGPRFVHQELPPDRPLDLDVVRLVAAVLEELSTGVGPTCAAEHGCRSLEAIVAAYTSHDQGHAPVNLPLQDPAAVDRILRIT